MAEGILDVQVETNLREILRDLREFDPRLATLTRRKLRESGAEAIEEMRQILAEPSPGIVTGTRTAITSMRNDGSRGPRRVRIVEVMTADAASSRSRGSRQEVADRLQVRVSTSARSQSVRLTGSGAPFAKSYNMRMWRHPIRFNPETTSKNDVPWVTQGGRPYFGAVIVRRGDQIRSRVWEALEAALVELARDRGTPTPVD